MPVFPVEWLIYENMKYMNKGNLMDIAVEKVYLIYINYLSMRST